MMYATGSYERIAERLIKGNPRPKPFCYVENGRLHRGTQSLHLTARSRMWRTFWRIKQVRPLLVKE